MSNKISKDPSFRAISYISDHGGCGHYRMIWPVEMVNTYTDDILIDSFNTLIPLPAFYQGVNSVRFQRVVNEDSFNFIKIFKQMQDKFNPIFNIIYEVDDVILGEDIPLYNKSRDFFSERREYVHTSMKECCNEITVPSKYMADYYADKTGNKNVTVIPNYVPKFWMDRFYSRENIIKNYTQNKSKPRVLFPCSASHFDVDNKDNHQDDFAHVNEVIAKNVDNFKFIFLGGAYPKALEPLIKSKKIESWKNASLYDYPYHINVLKPNVIAAPLRDNHFNKAKSDIKYSESCAFGLPLVCQNLEPYKKAKFKFNTGDEFIDLLKKVTKDESDYMKFSDEARFNSKNIWLENPENYKKFEELYTYPFKSKKRKLINSMKENK